MRKTRNFNFEITAIPATSDWGKCVTDFLAHIYSKCGSPHSQDHFRSNLEAFFSIEPRKLPHLYSKAEVMAWINSPGQANGREGQPVKAGTVCCRLTGLTSLYRYAQSYGVTGEDGQQYPLMRYLPPTSGIRRPKIAQEGNKALSDEEISRLFSAIPRDTVLGKRDFAICLMFLYCARRRDEIRVLQLRDLTQELLIDGTGTPRLAWKYRFFGKGHKSIADFAECPQIVVDALMEWLSASGRLATMEPGDYLFTTVPGFIGKGGYDPKRPLSEDAFQQIPKRYGRAAGLDIRRCHCHAFRHSSARARYAAGASLLDIKNLLRHQNLQTTSLYLDQLVAVADPTSALLNAKFGNL